jgi:hypothetical protein
MDPRDEEELGHVAHPQGSEEDRDERRLALSDEIARRWDPSQISKMVTRRGGAGQPLDMLTRARYERQFGVDLGGVRIYTGPFAQHVTRQHSAEAVTVGGTGMIFMAGTPDRSPVTASGQALLAHELTHVAQAARGIYRSAPGEAAPLATQEHEDEAHAVEQMEIDAISGGQKSAEPPKMSEAELLGQVLNRVCELLYDDERVYEQRNGLARLRP